MSRPIAPRQASAAADAVAQFAADVGYYLMLEPRQLPSRYLYDPLGSALFDAIGWLPWYEITRAEERLLRAHAGDVFRRLPSIARIVELGPGSGQKLRLLIESAGSRPAHLDVRLIDVSRGALVRSTQTLASLDGVRAVAHQQTYEAGLETLAADQALGGRTLMLFLGSNIGNFDPPDAHAFLRTIRAALAPEDALLLGADLLKPDDQLQLAYDDPLGVTAAFNRNMLVRINRELGGNFELDRFSHRATWNRAESRMEMHLVTDSAQDIRVEKAEIDFHMWAGEPIWTESSYKYRSGEVERMLQAASFRLSAHWVDEAAQFALFLLDAV